MLIFNLLGAVMIIAGCVAGFAVGGLVGLFTRDLQLPTVIGILVGMPVPPVLDLVYRWRHNRMRGWLRYAAPLSGGMFMLLPVWVLFGAVPVIGAAMFIVRKQVHLD